MKRTASLILCLVLICTSFAGCGAKKANNNNSTGTENTDIELKITVDSHYDDVDESTVRAYEKLCTAVMNYETEIKFNTALTDRVNQLFYTSFPLYSLVEGIDFLDDNSGVTISYVNEKEAHLAKVAEFKKAVSDIMINCGYGKVTSNLYLLNLYTYIATNVTIDNSVLSEMETILTKKGINSTISGMFEYLLLQAGVKASHVMNLNTDSVATMISMAQLNGKWYYFDPTAEIKENSGEGLMFFAMDEIRALNSASSAAFVYTDNSAPEPAEDDFFEPLKDCTSYTVEGNKVNAKLKGGKSFEFELNQ